MQSVIDDTTLSEQRARVVSRVGRIVRAVLLLSALALLAGRLVLFAQHSFEVLAFPWQIDFDEGVILHSSWLLAQGHNPYPANAPDHFVSSIYPPVYYILNAVALKIWGLNLWSGRALSLFGTLLAALSLVWWTWAETRSGAAGVVGAAIWLSLGPVIVWTTFYKQDTLALGLGALGAAMVAAGSIMGNRSRSGALRFFQVQRAGLPWLVWLAILPLVIGCWTKQSAVGAVAACGLYLVLRNLRSGLIWCAVAGALLAVPFVALNWLLKGQLYYHLAMPSAEPLSTSRLLQNMQALWNEHWPLVLMSALAALMLLFYALRARQVPPLSVWYALSSVPMLVWTNLSPHANYNHLLDGLLPICLLVGVGLGHVQVLALQRTLWGLAPLAAGVALLAVQAGNFTPLHDWYTPLGQPLEEKAQQMDRIEREIASAPGEIVLTEDNWLALKAGKSIPYDDPAQMAVQATSGHWDQSLLLTTIQERGFSVVVLEHDVTNQVVTPRWSPAALAALQANYVTKYRDVRFLDVPRPAPDTPPTALSCGLPGGPVLEGVFLPGGASDLKAGADQQLSLYWSVLAGTPAGPGGATLKYTARLVSAQGTPVWQVDLEPGATSGQTWPTWEPGTTHRDDLSVRVPETAAPGEYLLTLSAYLQQASTLTPVSFSCSAGVKSRQVTLAHSQVGLPWGR